MHMQKCLSFKSHSLQNGTGSICAICMPFRGERKLAYNVSCPSMNEQVSYSSITVPPASTSIPLTVSADSNSSSLPYNASDFETRLSHSECSEGELQGESLGEPSRGPSVSTTTAKLPSQAESVFNPTDRAEDVFARIPVTATGTRSMSDLDYLSELLAIQQNEGPKNLGFFGTRNMGVTHQKLVEILSYAMVTTGNHIYTSGATGTNAAVIRGALRANDPELLTVILPQSLSRQPAESQELLSQVRNVVEMPDNDHLPLLEASRICNHHIIQRVQQVICFAFHDSRLLLETCGEAKDAKKIVTLFYLD